jgi:ABC-type antimicrobial peptide transport system permease subunit
MIIEIGVIIAVLTSIPVGYLLSYVCRDEIEKRRKWYLSLGIFSLLASLILLSFNKAISLTLIYIAIVSFITLFKIYKNKEKLR